MSEVLTDGLLFPALVLALLGWLVPKMLSLVFPEGVRPLLILSFVSATIMLAISAFFFVGLYVIQGVPFAALFDQSVLAGISHFGWLGILSALFWGPIMVLSIAGLPKNWVEETW